MNTRTVELLPSPTLLKQLQEVEEDAHRRETGIARLAEWLVKRSIETDARAKLAILCALAFGLRVDPSQIPAQSTASIDGADVARARARGAAIRQIAHADFDRATSTLTAWVAPIEVPRESIFGRATGPQNAAIVAGEHSGETGIFGVGAGGDATAVAILSDIAAIARDKAAVVPAPVLDSAFHIPNPSFLIPVAEVV